MAGHGKDIKGAKEPFIEQAYKSWCPVSQYFASLLWQELQMHMLRSTAIIQPS